MLKPTEYISHYYIWSLYGGVPSINGRIVTEAELGL